MELQWAPPSLHGLGTVIKTGRKSSHEGEVSPCKLWSHSVRFDNALSTLKLINLKAATVSA